MPIPPLPALPRAHSHGVDGRAPVRTAGARLVFVSNRQLHRARFVAFGSVWPIARALSRVWPGEPFTIDAPK